MTGYALTYTRDGIEKLLTVETGRARIPELMICRTRVEADELRRDLLGQPGVTAARVCTVEEVRERAEALFEALPILMYQTAAAVLAS